MLSTDDVYVQDIEERLGRFKEVYNETSKKALGAMKSVKNGMISGENKEQGKLKEKIACARSASLKERLLVSYAVKTRG